MQLDTISMRFGIACPTNVTQSSQPVPIPTTTKPVSSGGATGAGIIQFGADDGGICANGLILTPYGVGTTTNTFTMYVFGWREIEGPVYQTGVNRLWVPVLLATFTSCTIDSVFPGIVNSDLGTTQYFCSAITLGTGNSGISVEVVSPGTGNGIAHAVIDMKGFRFAGVYFNTGSSATSCNALWAKV
jgi:hypothetical protein